MYFTFAASQDESLIPVGCKANSDCPLSQACINGACANPCVCGPNAECTVIRHHPVCFCKINHSGNPYLGCVKGKSSSLYLILYKCNKRKNGI